MTAIHPALTPEMLAQLRHELRTAVNQMLCYWEILSEDALALKHVGRRFSLEELGGAVREAVTVVNRELPLTRADVSPGEIAALFESLREPQARIAHATAGLLAMPGSERDEAFTADLCRIRSAAQRLLLDQAGVAERAGFPGVGSAAGAALPEHETGDRRARLLVVDDVEDNREVLGRQLQRQGYLVECAESGRAALQVLDTRPFDLVLLDVMMAEMDGYLVLERLKSTPVTRDTPVIMISALDDFGSVVRCIELGAEDYLLKPFDPVLLRARIGACLEKKRLHDAELQYLRDVEQVIEAAKGIEAGCYEPGLLTALGRRADGLGQLARVFDAMAVGIRAREERLCQHVSDLRLEVDQARQAGGADASPRSVGEVTQVNSRGRARRSAGIGDTLVVGQLFAARYQILGILGGGGMGTVYRARDRVLGQDIAIKVLNPEILGSGASRARFMQEIRLARLISHANVVRTHDVGECAGASFVTMEYVEGVTLRALIDTRGHMGVSSTLAIGAQLACALEAAHGHGVVHRDIKPQNLALTPGGVLKVMDFGIACLAECADVLAQAGTTVGTPAYMAPEQLLAETADVRSDLYAAGVVLYECLTGRQPFEAKSRPSTIAKVLHDEPRPPAAINHEVPLPLSGLVMCLLSKKPEDRPPSALELGHLLSEIT